MLNNFTTLQNEMNLKSPLSPLVLNSIGIYLSFILLINIIFNFLFLSIFIRYKELRNTFNTLVLAVSINSLFASAAFPNVILSNFAFKLTSSSNDCILSGFIIYFTACTNVYLMAFVSIERYYLINNCSKINQNNLIKIIILCVLFGLFWSGAPLVGWSHYSIEDNLVSCSIEWKEKSLNVRSYNFSILIFVFVIPFSLIISYNLKSILLVNMFLLFLIEYFLMFCI